MDNKLIQGLLIGTFLLLLFATLTTVADIRVYTPSLARSPSAPAEPSGAAPLGVEAETPDVTRLEAAAAGPAAEAPAEGAAPEGEAP